MPQQGRSPSSRPGQFHVIEITWQVAWNQYLPKCSCGWTGSYVASHTWARDEAAKHVAESAPASPPSPKAGGEPGE